MIIIRSFTTTISCQQSVHYPFITKLARLATHKYLTATAKITFTFQSNVTTYRILWGTSFTDQQITAIILPIHAFLSHSHRLNQPVKYTTLLHYSHIPNIPKKNFTYAWYNDTQIYAPITSCCPSRDFAQKAKSRGGTLVTCAYIKESNYSWIIQSYSQ